MNEPLRIAVCEDDPKDTNLLIELIGQSKITVKCDTFTSGESLLLIYAPGMYHLIFLDIYMTGMSGIEAADRIRLLDSDVMLAFTTTSREHALDVQRYRSLLYIEKPAPPEMVLHTLALAEAMRDKQRHELLTIPGFNKRQLDIRYSTIRYVEYLDKRCIFHLALEHAIETASTLSMDELEILLPMPRFFRTHRSYIVNFDHVDYPNKTDFIMKGGDIVYITQREYHHVIRAYDEYLFSLARKGGRV